MGRNRETTRCRIGTVPGKAAPASTSPNEPGLEPEAYDPHLDVDFNLMRDDDPPAPDDYGLTICRCSGQVLRGRSRGEERCRR
ncbi:hypothetical protein [Streptomyces sp. NPDC058770]|uniref:hypothetical protein n=1 Tax=unclassified Streptomyces TaxID=2593676 RepID=UPI00367A8394